jgi:alkaline phosphatase
VLAQETRHPTRYRRGLHKFQDGFSGIDVLWQRFHTGGNARLPWGGPGSEKVRGLLDNTEIFKIIAAAIEEK